MIACGHKASVDPASTAQSLSVIHPATLSQDRPYSTLRNMPHLPRQDHAAVARFQTLKQRISWQQPRIVFLGDSITHGWDYSGGAWQRYFGHRGAFNAGIGSDRIEHLLYRLANGQLARTSPDVIVVLIGTNNLGLHSADQISHGIGQVITLIHQLQPQAKIVVHGLFPRGRSIHHRFRSKISDVNSNISSFGILPYVIYKDVGQDFLALSGELPRQMMHDGVHLTPRGYQVWASALEPILQYAQTSRSFPEAFAMWQRARIRSVSGPNTAIDKTQALDRPASPFEAGLNIAEPVGLSPVATFDF